MKKPELILPKKDSKAVKFKSVDVFETEEGIFTLCLDENGKLWAGSLGDEKDSTSFKWKAINMPEEDV